MTGSRDINSATATAALQANIRPVVFVKLEFDGGDVNLHSELGDISFSGDTYSGAGTLGQVSAANEVSDLSSSQINLTLSGLPNTVVAILLGEDIQGRIATIFLGYLDLVTHVLVDTPTILYRGLMDVPSFQQDQNFTINLSIGNRFSAWNNPVIRRYNNANQQVRFPGDNGLIFVAKTVNKTITWGGAS